MKGVCVVVCWCAGYTPACCRIPLCGKRSKLVHERTLHAMCLAMGNKPSPTSFVLPLNVVRIEQVKGVRTYGIQYCGVAPTQIQFIPSHSLAFIRNRMLKRHRFSYPVNVSSMYDHGWRNITNIDFSKPCIEQGRLSPSSASRPGVKWLVMDACSLTFDDASFDTAIDKGTLDAIACSEAFDWFLPRMARSIVRVLRPGGIWMCVSFTPPEIALPLLEECKEWEVEVEKWRSFWMYVGRKRGI